MGAYFEYHFGNVLHRIPATVVELDRLAATKSKFQLKLLKFSP